MPDVSLNWLTRLGQVAGFDAHGTGRLFPTRLDSLPKNALDPANQMNNGRPVFI